ncbi:hypothetical protein OHU11_22875 [Streptomyces sp. NBC_00257]|nr:MULTISPECIES: hypothetical protein [unclassified Streptomyces]WTB55375.1 hypothetical protein OG832_20485 [Streptomyces sp. NBC_00826]WTH91743.1 hypothetical protein OIC43_23205 [Streptomyces sp. NBC_00825]WTI00471.1 hypothetical protein OHA23_23190 [Streptomyces sp. NBC_00822]MCX4865971.1 hypothetical protein [Streptomyces sp. NBC_00906]MCX4897210.1 hypothetical protein [Streptomyces sp. NBC_00892]
MAPPGSRTRTTDVWLLPEDERVVGQRIGDVLPRSGWLCSQPGPKGLHEVHLHPSLVEALDCGGRQAFLLLPEGAGAPEDVLVAEGAVSRSDLSRSAVLQFLCSRRFRDGAGEALEAGRLAVRWDEPEVGPERHRLLTDQTRLAWRALRSATRPASVEAAHGGRVSGMRIGPAAYDLVTGTGMPLTRGGSQRLRLAGGATR